MRKAARTITVGSISKKVLNEEIVLKHKLQRREGVWSKSDKSLLIDSILRDYVIPDIYIVVDPETNKRHVIDGVQRLSTFRDFLNNKFSLSPNVDPVVIDNIEYEVSKKKFSKLDEKIQELIKDFNLVEYEITDYTDKDIRELFSRLNGGKALNTTQKFTALYSDELSKVIEDIASLPFFEERLSPAQFKSSVDQSIVLETLMLCEASKDYDFGSFSKKAKESFIEYYNNNIDQNKIKFITEGIVKLNNVLPVDVKIPKTTLPFLCYASYRTLKDKRGYDKFSTKVNEFLDGYETNEEYKASLSNGTSSAESVKARFDYWHGIVNSL